MNKKITKILACVDFSEYSLMVLEYAAALATDSNSEILVLNVINQRDIQSLEMVVGYFPGSFPTSMNSEEYVRKMKEDRHEKIRHMIKTDFFDKKSMMSIKIDTGVPFEAILNNIESEGIDLVVMANKGRGNISRVLFGSAAEKVFRHSPVPVLSVRQRDKFKREK